MKFDISKSIGVSKLQISELYAYIFESKNILKFIRNCF